MNNLERQTKIDEEYQKGGEGGISSSGAPTSKKNPSKISWRLDPCFFFLVK